MVIVMALDPMLTQVLSLALGALFSVGAAHKLRDFSLFHATLKAYRLLPDALVRVAAGLVILAEIATATLLVLGPVEIGALLAMGLLIVYGTAIGMNLVRGRTQIDCGCHFGRGSGQISPALVARNGVLCIFAALLLLPVSARSWTWLDSAACLFGLLAAVGLYLTTETLIRNAQFWRWSPS